MSSAGECQFAFNAHEEETQKNMKRVERKKPEETAGGRLGGEKQEAHAHTRNRKV